MPETADAPPSHDLISTETDLLRHRVATARSEFAVVGPVILYATGSPILADVEESLGRARLPIACGVSNWPGSSYLSPEIRSICLGDLSPDLLALPFLVPLFTPAHRQKAAREAAEWGLHQPLSLTDPTSVLPRGIDLGPGCYINAGCTLGAGSEFGRFVFINRGASLGHHLRCGAFVSIGPGVTVAGSVTIGTGAMVGTGATILPGISIGDNAVVGAGSVVTRDVPAHCLVVGTPARIVRRDIGGYKGLSVE